MLLDICYHVIKNIQNSVNLLLSLLYESRKITCWCFMKEKKVAVIKLNDFFLFLHNDNLLFYDLIFVMSNWIKCFTSLTQIWTSPCLSLSFRRDSWHHCPSRCWLTVHGDLGTMVVMEERNGERLSGLWNMVVFLPPKAMEDIWAWCVYIHHTSLPNPNISDWFK